MATTEEFLIRFGHRWPTAVRSAVGVLVAVPLPLSGPRPGELAAMVVAVVSVIWSAVYLRQIRVAVRPWIWVSDTLLVCALCLAQPWLVRPEDVRDFLGVSPVVSIVVVAVQWYLPSGRAAAVTLAVTGSYIAGAVAVPGVVAGEVLLTGGGLWIVVEAVMSRLIWTLVRRGARTADRLLEQQHVRERSVALAAARRAEQRRHWATVHDTSASTLMMIGLGEVRGSESWLEGQLQRDIAALAGAPLGATDLCAAVDAAVPPGLDVWQWIEPGLDPLPPHAVEALAGAAGEALRNVRRHAGVASATVNVSRGGSGGVVVVVADRGSGFDPTAVPPRRSGIAVSVRGRMSAAGGSASVDSAPGSGTVVRLEWPDG